MEKVVVVVILVMNKIKKECYRPYKKYVRTFSFKWYIQNWWRIPKWKIEAIKWNKLAGKEFAIDRDRGVVVLVDK